MKETKKKFPLSFSQEQLWLQLQQSVSPLIFNFSSIISFPLNLDTEAIQNGINFLFERHQPLRLTIHTGENEAEVGNGQPFQIVQDYSKIEIPIINPSLVDNELNLVLKSNLLIPFELDKGPLCKFYIIKSSEALLLQGVAHHLVLDGIGTQVIEKEGKMIIQDFANGFSKQEICQRFPPLDYTFTDFVIWQRTQLVEKNVWGDSCSFWKNYLDGITPLNLGKDGPRIPSVGLDAERIEFHWPRPLSQSIQSFAKANGLSSFVILTSGLSILLGRLSSGQTDFGILIGKHGRSSLPPKFRNMIGHFSNVLPLRINLNTTADFIGLVNQVKENIKNISTHQDYPIQLILKDLEAKNGQRIDQHLFFPVTLIMTPNNSQDATNYLELDNSKLSQEIILHVQANFTGYVKYNPLIHSRSRIQGMLHNWKTFMENALEFPIGKSLNEFEINDPDEIEKLIKFGTGGKVKVPELESKLTLVDLFERQVEKTPNGIAIFTSEEAEEEISYSVLASESRALAQILLNEGQLTNQDKFVAVLMEQSTLFIKTTLGILMSGKTIAVLSIHSSRSELSQMLADIGNPLLISTSEILQRCGFKNYSRNFDIDSKTRFAKGLELKRVADAHAYNNDDDAYCIFTSGTTGKRKGIILKHSNIIHFCTWQIQEKKYTTKDRTLGFNDVSSDSSLSDIWSTLLVGATLCIPPQPLHYDMAGIWEWIANHQISIVQFQTALTNKMLASETVMNLARKSRVRMLTCGGDRLDSSFISASSLPFELHNEYGLTETTVPVTSTIMSQSQTSPGVGRPIWNTNVWILDTHLNLLPIGVIGKIHVHGPGIGKYWSQQEELNKVKFVKLRKTYSTNACVFNTGDLGYWDYNGDLNIVGRMDSQVKFRSYRIELKEIEGILTSYPKIQKSVVQILTENGRAKNEEELIAYCQLNPSDSQSSLIFGDLIQYLNSRLPYYSVPSKIYTLPLSTDFPLNSNGKIDFQKLNQERKHLHLLSPSFIAPGTEEEIKIATIWSEVLQIPLQQIGLHDHFFALGGHSFLIMKFVRRLQDIFPNVKIPPEAVFREPTIYGLSKVINQISSSDEAKTIWPCEAQNSQGKETMIDFEEEIRSADLEFQISQDLPISTSPNIFLTGATGFLGSSVLVELLKQGGNSKIYCLVRGESAEEAKSRLSRAISPFLPSLSEESKKALEKIHVLWGDMSLQSFGLESSIYEKLVTDVGVIYHTADFVHLLQPYHLLGKLNVEGIKQILRLATTTTIKTLHYVSSIEVYYDLPGYYNQFGPIVYEKKITDLQINPVEYPTGYSQCKWVAEQLVSRAMDQGLPAIIYRPGEITAHSKLNLIHPADVLYLSLKYCVRIGAIPNVLKVRIPSGSVDFNSKAIVAISMQKENIGKTFHVFAHDILIQDVVDLIFSNPSLVPRPISIVSIDEWEKTFCDYILQFEESTKERKEMERYLCFWFHFKRHFSARFYHKLKVCNANTKLALGDLDALSESTLTQDIIHALCMTSSNI